MCMLTVDVFNNCNNNSNNNNNNSDNKIALSSTGSDEKHWCVCDVCRSARCFYIVSQWNSKVLDVRGDEASAGARVIVYERKPVVTANQVWYEDEAGILRSKLNGYVIDTSCK